MNGLALSRRGLIGAALALGAITVLALLAGDLEGLWRRSLVWILQQQRALHRTLTEAMQAVRHDQTGALWWMVSASFLYGVCHAAGPGHGKVVIATYLATQESRLSRGILLTVLSSLAQGLTAIVAVGAIILVLQLSMRDAEHATLALETGSYGLVALLGGVLCWRSGRRLVARGGGHHHHGAACGCGHEHGPSANDLAAPATPAHLAMIVLSIGIRPCTGAVLVMLLALGMGRVDAGIASVMAMAAGTALTVSALAALSVYARRAALAFAAMLDLGERHHRRLIDAAALAGGLILVTVGTSLLVASWQVVRHPLL